MRNRWVVGMVLAGSVWMSGGGNASAKDASPPLAKVIPVELEAHGQVRVDGYHWLRERDNPEVRAYLEAENAYTQATMAPLKGFEEALFTEIVGRIEQDDATPPARLGEYFYYTRYVEGQEYPIHCRKAGSLDAPEEVILDVNALAAGHEFFSVRSVKVSSDQNLLAYAYDAVGRRKYNIAVKDLATGELVGGTIVEVTSNLAWAEDGETLLYARQHPETLRSYQIYRHAAHSESAADVLVYEERDEEFETYVAKTAVRSAT